MTIRRVGVVLAHHWLFVGVLTAALVALAAVISIRSPRSYRASALLQVQVPVDPSGAISLQDTLTSRERAVTITTLGNTGEVTRRAAQRTDTTNAHCSFSQVGQSEFIVATCTGHRRSLVAQAANTYAAALQGVLERQRAARVAELTRQYKTQIKELRAQGVPPQNFPTQPVYPSYRELELIDSALEPASPYAPRPVRTILIALALGLLVNTALAFMLESVQNRARSPEELQRALGEPLLAAIPTIRRGVRPGSVVQDGISRLVTARVRGEARGQE